MPKAQKKEKLFWYINREMSWLSFNERVLQEAEDENVPLLERLKFLGIFSNNRDEFYRVRVATIKRLKKIGAKALEILGTEPSILLNDLIKKVLNQQQRFEKIYQNVKSELKKSDVYIISEKELISEQKEFLSGYFNEKVLPHLFPVMIYQSKPFPYMKDKASYLYVKLKGKQRGNVQYALIEIPVQACTRFVMLPKKSNKHYIILLDDVIRLNLHKIFDVLGYDFAEAYNVKLTRDAELDMDQDFGKGILEKIRKSLEERKKGQPVRFVYDMNMPPDMLNYIIRRLGMSKMDDAIPGGRYHNFKDFIDFPDIPIASLRYPKTPPIDHPELKNRNQTILEIAKKKDLLFYFPYHNFNHIIDLLREASIDPSVESIYITLYRLAESSNIANALINAAKNGKDVLAVVELQARFDEENNLYWSNKLKEAGVKVIFGVPGLKVHSKLFLIKQNVRGKKFSVAHIGTGNFNEKTSRIYTDFSLLTADKKICRDVDSVFVFYQNNYIIPKTEKLFISPFNMRDSLMELMDKEIRNAREGKEAYIILKLNNLVDKELIKKLYEASDAGVKITLLVRGSCSLVPGIPGVSENIRAYSLVDKFLEHARVLIFANDGKEKIYITSADWMTRNMDFRSEVAVPVEDRHLKKIIRDIVHIQLSDNVKLRVVDEYQSNPYVEASPNARRIRSQIAIFDYLKKHDA
ncbi:MAG: polyphosphate kinase 1 [Bacteroidia bacterium]|nr:polyphosphate kinase 1 [Bacteroidia bacterium]